jgi:hypothetical protein
VFPLKVRNLISVPDFIPGGQKDVLAAHLVSGNSSPLLVQGQFAFPLEDPNSLWLVRDRLGINKLFYFFEPLSNELTFGNSLREIAIKTGAYNAVLSVPPGHAVQFNKARAGKTLIKYYDMSEAVSAVTEDLNQFRLSVDQKLSGYFTELAATFPNARFVVCLSGGLDSSVIAGYAARHLKNPMAATFCYDETESDDFKSAKKIAAALGLDFLPVRVERKVNEAVLAEVLLSCQDWRDFNVHCAWVNDRLAASVRGAFPDDELIFITGDLMNEFVADYAPVQYKGSVYYEQPKIAKGRLRKFFTFGLDTSDREVGVFHRYGIRTVQPFSAVAEDYLALPDALFEQSTCKETLNTPLIRNAEARELVNKAKVRAQVGGTDGGTLGLFHDSGITQETLKKKWEELFRPLVRDNLLEPLFFSGRYRAG